MARGRRLTRWTNRQLIVRLQDSRQRQTWEQTVRRVGKTLSAWVRAVLDAAVPRA